MRKPYVEVRSSPIHGLGAFAARPIRKGTRIIEYAGQRISPEEADRRYDDDQTPHPHVLLFSLDRHKVIDAGVAGNEARFINHSCEPNCQAVIEAGRVYIEALCAISEGEELTYDYNLTRDDTDDEDLEKRYACHCGALACRGTMLKPKRQSRNRKRQRQKQLK